MEWVILRPLSGGTCSKRLERDKKFAQFSQISKLIFCGRIGAREMAIIRLERKFSALSKTRRTFVQFSTGGALFAFD